MKKLLTIIMLAIALLASTDVLAKGSFSSGGRGFSGGGGRSFSSSRSYSSPSRSYSSPSRSYSTRSYTTHTTISRNYYGGGAGYYYHPYMSYPGFGMGYGYSNGLIEGLIIGNLMHPAGTVPYTYGGYSGNALLYPDGRVVDQNGYQVGVYQNGQFASVQGGQMIAQAAPQNPQVAPVQSAQPVIIANQGLDAGDYFMIGFLVLIVLFFFVWLVAGATSMSSTETTTTIINDTPRIYIKGKLKREQDKETGQFYVIDPADKTKTYVNEKDDMYEDADENVWRLV